MESVTIDCVDGAWSIVDSDGVHEFETVNKFISHILDYEYAPQSKTIIPIVILENGDDRLFIWDMKPEDLISVCQELANG